MQGVYQKVNIDRLVQRVEELAKHSMTACGVTRLSFTGESEGANQLVSGWMREAGMTVRRDALNNVIGRYEGNQPDAPVLMIGSHLDSVVEGGKYDGMLGVITGIEVIQTLFENGIRLSHPIEVIGFCDEEGVRFHSTFLGSKAIAGTLEEKDLLAKDKNGLTIADAMRETGLDPRQFKLAARDPEKVLGYIELHIEQGPFLEQADQACGVVNGIAGQARYEFRIEGLAGHAGTVPVPMRKDALVGAAEFIQVIERIALRYESLVATVGKLAVHPGASNVIPGSVEGTLDIRSIDDERRKAAENEIFEECKRICHRRGLTWEFNKNMESPAVACSSRIIRVMESVLENHQMKPIQIASGAGHDAMTMASLTEIGMIFVRCTDGLSHHPDEHVTAEDMKQGASILLDVILKLAA